MGSSMANTLAPTGLTYHGTTAGISPNFGVTTGKIALGNATKIFRNDPIKMLSTGYIAQWTAGTSVAQLLGTFMQCKYRSVITGKTVWSDYWPGADAAADAVCYFNSVVGVPLLFLGQSSGVPITRGNIGNNIDVTMATAGSTLTQLSGALLDPATIATTATLPFRIIDLYPGIDNGGDVTTNFNKVVVQANSTATAGI